MKNNDFNQLIESIKQAGQIKNGDIKPSRIFKYNTPDVKKIRRSLHISQSKFALMIGVSPRTLQNWEQGRREPDGPAKALLRVASKNPQAILEALYT